MLGLQQGHQPVDLPLEAVVNIVRGNDHACRLQRMLTICQALQRRIAADGGLPHTSMLEQHLTPSARVLTLQILPHRAEQHCRTILPLHHRHRDVNKGTGVAGALLHQTALHCHAGPAQASISTIIRV